MAKAPDYSSLVADAEKAVQSVKDPELKRIAFQKVLDDLLGGGGGDSNNALRRVKANRSQAPAVLQRPLRVARARTFARCTETAFSRSRRRSQT